MQVTFVKTIVGWYNIYADGEVININPTEFKAYFPHVSPKASMGCFEVDSSLFNVDQVEFLEEDSHDWNDLEELKARKMA
ncbi:hypothetical protein ACQKCU_15170 [Heyndrickxia sporothermodurans]